MKENKNIIKIITFAFFLYFILQNIQTVGNVFNKFIDIIFPFILGGVIAFILNLFLTTYEEKFFKPKKVKGKIRKNKIARPICIVLSILTVLLILTIILLLIIPEFAEIIRQFIYNLPIYLNSLKDFGVELTQKFPNVNTYIQNIEINTEYLKENLMEMSKKVIGITINQVSNLFSGLIDTVIAIVFSVYLLANKEKLGIQIKKIVYANLNKEKADYVIKIAQLSKDAFRNFITGQGKEAIVLGILCAIGLLILRIPYAGTIGILIGATSFIPIVGAFIGASIGAVLIVATEPIKALIFIIFIIVLQQLENHLIYPHIVGKNIGLPSMWVLVAITIGGSIGGIVGMVIGLPIFSVIYTIVRENTNRKLKLKQMEGYYDR